MPERPVIVNTSPLFYLFLASKLNLLEKLYGRILVPPAVVSELQAGSQANLKVPNITRLSWVEVKPIRSEPLVPALVDLGPGEAEVIALGLEHRDSLLVMDDRLARQVARLNGLHVTGTLGVLLKAKEKGHVQSIGPVIEALRREGLRLSDALVASVLGKAGELPQ